MKKSIFITITILTIIQLIFSCDNLAGVNPEDITSDGSDSTSDDGSDSSESEVIAKSMKAYDANGSFLGYCTYASGYFLFMYSQNGYFYSINWDGSFTDGGLYYTGQNLTGTAFYAYLDSYAIKAKTVFSVNNVLYTYVDSNSDSLADINASITQYQSVYSGGTTTNYETPYELSTFGYSAFSVQTITKSTAGIPSSITTPISLVSE